MNNAQTFTELVPLEEKTDAMMAASLESGPWATFWSMQAVFPHMRDQHFGRIVNFCSLNMVTGAWYSVDYNAAKGAIQALTRSAAREWGPYGITVNAIAPAAASEGYLAFKKNSPEAAAAAEKTIPLQRMGDPEEDSAASRCSSRPTTASTSPATRSSPTAAGTWARRGIRPVRPRPTAPGTSFPSRTGRSRDRFPPCRSRSESSASIEIHAAPEVVWALVADITRDGRVEPRMHPS